MSEHHSSIDLKVQQLVDEDLRRALFQHAAEAMMMNIDYYDIAAANNDDQDDDGLRDRFTRKQDVFKLGGKKVLWERPESAHYVLDANDLDRPKDLYDLGVEKVSMTYFPSRHTRSKEIAESVVIDLLPLGGDSKKGDSLAFKLQIYEPGQFEEVDITKIERSGEKQPVIGEATHEDVEYLQKVLDLMHRRDESVLATL